MNDTRAPKKTRTEILIVDDEQAMRRTLTLLLDKAGYATRSVSTTEEARQALAEKPAQLVISDLRLGNESGMELIRHIKKVHPNTESILLTAYGSIESAVEAIHAGAYDYVTKPFTNEQLLLKVGKAVERHEMRSELTALRAHVAMSYGFDNIVGNSSEMRKLKETAKRIAPTDITTLITGASGTGKELLTRAVHHHSDRRSKPLITVDCSTIPEPLFESELFGHTKGAFTTAVSTRRGLLEEADGGTVFLDEVNNIPLSVQPKLLRFLQDSVIRSVGSSTSRKVDVRIIAATNRDLAELVADGKFREDLYYRLNVIPLRIPTLAERAEDIPVLAEYFVRRMAQEMERPSLEISPSALDKLINHVWPGNVRELENTLKRAAALCRDDRIDSDAIIFVASRIHKEPATHELVADSSSGEGLLEDTQRTLIKRALAENDWNFTQTAQELGIGRTTLWRKVKKYNLKKEQAETA
ncbi:response regulator [candidate division GN15 bacterium]|nr:response regulator [candidate division GN15 bacterium]